MEVSLRDLKASERGLIKLMNSALPAGAAFKIMGVLKPVREGLQLLENIRIEILRKHGKTKDDGSIQIDPGSPEEKSFLLELESEMSKMVDLEKFTPIALSAIGKAEISAVELEPLMGKFIADDSQEQEEK